MRRIALFLLILIVALPAADEVKIIKDPKPTCVEKEYRRLVKVRELKEDENSEDFLVSPISLAVDARGHIFAFDVAQARIFQYDPDLNLVRTFGRRGQGPGEIGGNGPVLAEIFLRGDEIYLPDGMNRKVLCFSTKGKLIREIPMKDRESPFMAVALDMADLLYFRGNNDPANQNVIDCHDSSGKYVRGYLDRKYLMAGLFRKFSMTPSRYPNRPGNTWYANVHLGNLFYTVTSRDRLIIYSAFSGHFWVYQKGELAKHGKLWPKKALADYRFRAERAAKTKGKAESFFVGLVPDLDDPERFFLRYGYFREGDKSYLYQYNLSGELVKVCFIQDPERSIINVRYKRGGLYYATARNRFSNLTICIYREVEDE